MLASGPPVLLLFSLTGAASAFLLFVVQPMFARLVLPILGGTPSVWTACMLFFQSALLAGYAYAHVLVRRVPPRASLVLHAAVLLIPLLALPLRVPQSTEIASSMHPTIWLLGLMGATVGLPFAALSTTAPLLQQWFAASPHRAAADPYFLYASSNAGSVLALISYPVLIEPRLALGVQTRLWAAGYLMAVVLILICVGFASGGMMRRVIPSGRALGVERPGAVRRLAWLALSFVPSSLLLGVTTYLTTDLAVVPLLWVVPLLIYLLAFIVAFSQMRERLTAVSSRLFPLALLPLVLLMIAGGGAPLWFALPLHLLTFASMSILCLGRLASARPDPQHLTEFYIWIGAGGMLGGVFNSVVAPWIFTGIVEYPLMIAAGCLLLAVASEFRAASWSRGGFVRATGVGVLTAVLLLLARKLELAPGQTLALLGPAALVCFSLSRNPAGFAAGVSIMLIAGAAVAATGAERVLHAERTFFGVYRVSIDPGPFLTLYHGTTVHGRQALGSGTPEPLTYYHRASPIADVIGATARVARSIGVVGLGVGTLAAYARPGERWTFYEIDRAVERIARNERLFRFLAACGECTVAIGDARVTLESSTVTHDLLVLDAFSSDAIPVHLVTKEALTLYASRLTSSGLMAFHVSNRHVRLRPVLARLARDLRWSAIARFDHVAEGERGYSSSDWVVLAREASHFSGLHTSRDWAPLNADTEPAWTDDFSNLWRALRWR